MMLSSYGSICNLGHKSIITIFDDEVTVEEKVDGSQFTFGMVDGAICFRSKGAEIYLAPGECLLQQRGVCNQKMFQKATDTAQDLYLQGLLVPGWIYYGEFLQKPKHNTLKYDRVPNRNIIIFDIDRGDQDFLSPQRKAEEAIKMGLECVPLLFQGKIGEWAGLQGLLDTISVLGGTKIEGMVIKSYNQYTIDKKYMKGKYVSEEFKESHQKNWKSEGNKKDIIQELIFGLRTDARWDKAIIHLKERGELTGTPKDIGALLKEVQIDIEKEEIEAIKDALYKHFRKSILRGSIAGLPEWYKEKLAKKSFKEEN